MDEIGLDGRRLEMYHIGASDAPNWARAVREMTDRALELGPNPVRVARMKDQSSSAPAQAGAPA